MRTPTGSTPKTICPPPPPFGWGDIIFGKMSFSDYNNLKSNIHQGRDKSVCATQSVISGQFFSYFLSFFMTVAMCDPVHDVEIIHGLC